MYSACRPRAKLGDPACLSRKAGDPAFMENKKVGYLRHAMLDTASHRLDAETCLPLDSGSSRNDGKPP